MTYGLTRPPRASETGGVRVLDSVKATVKQKMPRVTRAYRLLQAANRGVQNRLRSPEAVFSEIHRRNKWGNDESVSGVGSTLESTEAIREELPPLFKELGLRSLLDAPCGDYNWVRQTPFELDAYWGMDIVPEIIARNARLYGTDRVRFIRGDLVKDPLPRVDVVMCRDCFNHLSYASIIAALRNFKRSGATYALVTTDVFLGEAPDIVIGQSRSVNLQAPPLRLPAPERLIFDGPRATSTSPGVPQAAWGRNLGLWRLSHLSV